MDYIQRRGEYIPLEQRQLVSRRYHVVTQAVNRAFWNSQSDTDHSLYVGSYGRNTAIETSDIDILVCLPEHEYKRYDAVYGNGQSRLLQAVRRTILSSYPRSDVRADGQVVKIEFKDGISFEILPAFENRNYYYGYSSATTYTYPDANMGGNWKSTNPKAEQEAMAAKNKATNGLLNDTCKHIRYIRDNYFSSYHLSGIVIDSFVYHAMGFWRWLDFGEPSTSPRGTFENTLLQYFNDHYAYAYGSNLLAPGSNQAVNLEDSRVGLSKVLNYICG